VAERLVAQEVDALLVEPELDITRGRLRDAALAFERLLGR